MSGRYIRAKICLLAALLLVLSGCSDLHRIKDIRINSVGVKYVTPTSHRSAEGVLLVEVDNPAMDFTVSDLYGTIYRDGREMGWVSAGEVQVQGHSCQIYELPCTATLSSSVSLVEVLAIAARRSLEGFTVDIRADARIKGIQRTLEFNDIDLSKFTE